jgi:hypothetical protein
LQAGQNWNELLQSDHLVEGSVQFTNGFGQFLFPVLPRVDFFLQLQRRFNPREQLHFLERFLDVIRCARVERHPQDLLLAAGGLMMIGISRKASTALMRRHASIPSISGIFTSITIKSISFAPAPAGSRSRYLNASWLKRQRAYRDILRPSAPYGEAIVRRGSRQPGEFS